MAEQLKNSLDNPTSTLASGITAGATSLTVATGQGSRFPASGNFRIKLTVATNDTLYELCLVTTRSGDVLTVTRAAEGTSAQAFSAGDYVDLVFTVGALEASIPSLEPTGSSRNVIQPTGAAIVPLTVKGAASQSALLTDWQASDTTSMLGLYQTSGKRPRLRFFNEAGEPYWRLLNWSTTDGESGRDHAIGFTFNEITNDSGQTAPSSGADVVGQHYARFYIESRFTDLFEWNIDQGATGSSTSFRSLAYGSNYDTGAVDLKIGTLITNGGGIEILGGTGQDTRLTVKARLGQVGSLFFIKDSASVDILTIAANGNLSTTGGATFGQLIAGQNALEISPSNASFKHTFNLTDNRYWLSSNGNTDFGTPSGTDGGALMLGVGTTKSVISGGGSGQAQLRFFTGNVLSAPVLFIDGGGKSTFTSLFGGVPLVGKAIAGQTGNLQEWQNSSATVLLAVGLTGFVELLEQSDPAAPAVDKARLYVKDNGAGKTQLVARFPTGAVQVLATEP